MSTKVASLVICDDIRKEISNKEILIGVYSGRIQVGSYPAVLNLSFWIELESDRSGTSHWHIRFDAPSGNPPIEIEFDLEMIEAGSSAAVFVGLPIHVERDGEIAISMKEDDGDWFVAKRKAIARAPVRAA